MPEHDIESLLSRLTEIEELLRFPAVDGHTSRAEKVALFIARRAPGGRASHLAMQVVSEAAVLRRGTASSTRDPTKVRALLQKLRTVLRDAQNPTAAEDLRKTKTYR